MQDEEVFDMCVGSLIICCKPNCAVTFRLHFVRDWICHDNTSFLICHLNLQLTQLGMDYFKVSKFNSRLSRNFSNLS